MPCRARGQLDAKLRPAMRGIDAEWGLSRFEVASERQSLFNCPEAT
jgi:hypothetical protein